MRAAALLCLLASTALAGGLDVPLSRVGKKPFAWDLPKVVDSVKVQGEMATSGIPVTAEAVRSKEKPELLLQHIVRQFVEAGFYLPPAEAQVSVPGSVTVTALDADTFVSYTAILKPGPGSDTTVILSRAFLGQREESPDGVAPLFPGALEVAHSRVEEAQAITYSVSDPKADVLAFYRQKLGPAGYRETDPGVFQGPNDRLEIYVHPQDAGLSVAVLRRLVGAATTAEPRSPGH